MADSKFLSFGIDSWEDDSFILPLSLFPGGPLVPTDLKKWFVTDGTTVPIAKVSVLRICAYTHIRITSSPAIFDIYFCFCAYTHPNFDRRTTSYT